MKVRELPAELREKAKIELNEDPDRIEDDLNCIRDWLKFQKHLKFKDDDQFLLGFLRGCKFSLETVKKKLDCFYTIRTLAPEFYVHRSPFNEPIQKILKNNLIFYYSSKLAFPTICYYDWSGIDKNNISFEEVMKHYFMAVDLFLNKDDQVVVNGIIVVVDCKDLSFKSVMHTPVPTLKKYFFITQNAFPIRIKGFCAINAPSAIETLYKMFEIVVLEKLRNRMHIYSKENNHKLFDHVPQNMLPNEIGGKAGSIAELGGAWKKRLESYSDRIKEEDQYKSIEILREGKAKTQSEVFGLEGSFRKLNFD